MPSLIFDKCCFCIELKTGCFIIAYVNLVFYTYIMYYFKIVDKITINVTGLVLEDEEKYQQAGIMIAAISGVFLLFLILFLAFAIVLLVGLYQDKAGHVKAYLIYGTVFAVLNAIYAIINIARGKTNAASIILMIISLLLNIYFLLVIRSQYYRMKDPAREPAVYNTA